MKTRRLIYSLFAALTLLTAGCTPDEYELGGKDFAVADLVEGIAFKVTPDEADPNTIHLTSLLPSKYSVSWQHPQGYSTTPSADIQIAFPGKYSVTFGVETRGGMVYGEPYEFEITTTNLSYVSDPLWTALTGGVGHSKTWVPVDYQYSFPEVENQQNWASPQGELTYADPSAVVEYNNWAANWDPGYGSTNDEGIYTSSMTFSLMPETGATVHIVNNTTGAQPESDGMFLINSNDHTINFTDCELLHTQSEDSRSSNWSSGLKILTLTDNLLQVGVMRDNSEGAWWMVWNFVSKEYKDNYEKVQPDITLPDGWLDDISQNVVTTVNWTLSKETPFNWMSSDGTLLNDWNSLDDYVTTNWGWGNIVPDAQYGKFRMTLDSADGTVEFSDAKGNITSGTYSLDEKGWFTFTGVAVPSFRIGDSGDITFSADADNRLRVLKIHYDNTGKVDGMWVGKLNENNPNEYVCYFLDASSAAGGNSDPYAAWNSALSGKTFTQDYNWFVDWCGFDGTGGWTSASIFGDDYTSNGWCYNEAVRRVCESTRLTFNGKAPDMTATLVYTNAEGKKVSASGPVTIDNDNSTMTFAFDMTSFAGTGVEMFKTNNSGFGAYWTKPLSTYEWPLVSHGGSNLGNVSANGFWLGYVSQAMAAGSGANELTVFHWILVE